jgi:hypothetical protein
MHNLGKKISQIYCPLKLTITLSASCRKDLVSLKNCPGTPKVRAKHFDFQILNFWRKHNLQQSLLFDKILSFRINPITANMGSVWTLGSKKGPWEDSLDSQPGEAEWHIGLLHSLQKFYPSWCLWGRQPFGLTHPRQSLSRTTLQKPQIDLSTDFLHAKARTQAHNWVESYSRLCHPIQALPMWLL